MYSLDLLDSVVTSCAVVKEGHDLEAQATEGNDVSIYIHYKVGQILLI